MTTFNKKKWLKVIEFAVVGAATLLVSFAEISDFYVKAPCTIDYSCETSRRYDPQTSRRSETAVQQRQLLLFLLKLCCQILIALNKDDDTAAHAKKAQQLLLLKLCLHILATL